MAILTTKYEVFLSCRGPDTRQGFTDVLYNYLKEVGIQVFRDDDELAGGDRIELVLDAMKNSTICVPIFSKSFASSAWCLSEVAKMVELNKFIIPIFYDVTVEDVKLKTPLFVDLLKDQHQKYGREKALVEEWEKALVEVTKVKGRKLNDDMGFYIFSQLFAAEILFKLIYGSHKEVIHKAGLIKASSQAMAIPTTKYEVFLSFRGRDTRQGFTDVLYNYLKEIGIQVFRDDDELAGGDKIESILDAMKNSTICVPIFSKSFASSAWCLREVAKMVELNKVIIPIFCDVTVDDVNLNTPLYVDLLKDQHQKHGREEALVEEWEKALVEVTKVKGRKLNDDTGFYVFSKQFAAELLLKLGGKQQFTIHRFVEMTDQIEIAMDLLDIQSDDVVFLGLYGMGGIGKTTLAKTIFNRISSRYEACSFLANIQEELNTKGLECLQKKLLQDLNPKASSITDCAHRIKSSLQMKSVLIVLDDVTKISHIRELIGEPSSFGAGSRIIITTRDERVVVNFMPTFSSSDESSTKVSPRIARMEIKGMYPKQAMQLFCGHAFGSSSPPPDYMSLSNDVISICAGLPLALEVIGSLLCGASIQSWIAKISKLKEIPAERVQDKLMIIYEVLEKNEKEIFLDIACSFINCQTTYPTYLWEACGFYPNRAVPVLLSMSLVKITDGKFQMHDQLRDLGRKIVSKEGSRIVSYEDTLSALERQQSKQVVSLRLDPSASADNWINLTTFENVRFLWVAGEVAVGRFWELPKNITLLNICLVDPNFSVAIRGMDSNILRKQNTSYLMKLVILQLDGSSISDNWDGWVLIQKLRGLKILMLNECKRLTRMPNFSKMVALEYLHFRGCINLVKINKSIGKLLKLKQLILEGCVHLQELPEEVGNLEDLEYINMNATDISTLPNSIGKLKNLHVLSLKSCESLDKLPEGIGDLGSLVELDISYSRKLKELPATIGRLVKLEYLVLESCEGITRLPDSIGDLASLVELNLSGCCQINELPSSVIRLVMLKELSLKGCTKIVKLPDDFGNLKSLVKLELAYTGVAILSSETIRDLKLLKEIDLSGTPVRVLPDTVTQLSHLETLTLTGKLPEESIDVHALRELDLENTTITSLPDSIGRMEKLERLNLGNCKFLKDLPESLENLHSLRQLHLGGVGITSLPDSIGRLGRLEHLNLRFCESLEKLPDSLGNLQSLVHLNLHSSGIRTLPPSIGKLERLEHLDLSYCSMIRVLPDSFGDLRSLAFLDLSDTEIATLPDSIGRLENLELLDLSHCQKIKTLPDSLGELKALKKLELSHSTISQLPSTVNHLSVLQSLNLLICDQLQELPELPNSLKELKINSDVLNKVPDLSNLQDLISLELTGDAIFGWNGSFPSNLQSLTVELISIHKLPDLSNCSQLNKLKLKCQRSLEVFPNLSGLQKLVTLETESCLELVEIPGIGKLQSLTSLCIRDCPSLLRLENLGELQALRVFKLLQCEKLTEIPGFGELRGLTEARVENCGSLEKLENLTALKELKEFSLIGCRCLTTIPSLAELRGLNVLRIQHFSLERLEDLMELEELKELSLIGSRQLTKIHSLGKSQCMVFLHIENCPFLLDLENLTDLQQLKHFSLRGCEKLNEIPGLGKLLCLKELTVEDCDSLQRLDNLAELKKLEELSLIACRQLTEIPGIGKLQNLITLYIMNCPSLVSLENVGELKKLRRFDLIYCRKLIKIPGLGELQGTEVRVEDCDSLERTDDFTEL